MTENQAANNKRIAKNTIMLYIRMFLTMIVTLYTSRIVLQILGITDYGIYNVVGGVVAMMGIINSAMSVSTQRYLTYHLGKGDMKKLKMLFSTSFNIYIILSIIVIVLGETVGLWFVNNKLVIPPDRLVAANFLYQFSILSCVNGLLLNPYSAIIIAREKMDVYAYVSIIEVILKLAIVYVLLVIPFDKLIGYGALYLVVSLFITMVYRIYCVRNFSESRYEFCWDNNLFKQLLGYSGWNLFGAASGLMKGQGLNILLNVFFNPAINAARGIAYQVNGAVTMFFTNFYTAVRPQITKYYAQNKIDEMFDLVFRSSRFSFYLMLFISMPVLLETEQIINMWLGQIPPYTVTFVRIIIWISIIDCMANPFMTAAHATGNIKLYQSVVGTIVILNVPISYCILKWFVCKPIVVFVVSLFLSSVAFVVRLYLVRRLVEFSLLDYFKKVVFRTFIVSLASFIVPIILHLNMQSNILSFIIITIVSIFSSSVCIYLIGLSASERDYIRNFIVNKIKK